MIRRLVLALCLLPTLAWATFPTVQTTANGTDVGPLSHAITVPASIAANDTLLLFIAYNQEIPTFSGFPAGWTLVKQQNLTVCTCGGIGVWTLKQATGSEANFTLTSSASVNIAWRMFRISGASNTTAAEATANMVDNSSSMANDPPNLIPSWGAADTLWFAAIAVRTNVDKSSLTYPTSYTNTARDYSIPSLDLGTCRRELNAASENPATFAWTDEGDRSVTLTVGVDPGPPAATGGFWPFTKREHPPTVASFLKVGFIQPSMERLH